MENNFSYSIYLPLYKEASPHFRKFVSEMTPNLPMYLAQISQSRLNFLPSSAVAETDGQKVTLPKASIPLKSLLKRSSRKTQLKRISRFATQFNMLNSIASSRGNKCICSIELCQMQEKFPKSVEVLNVTMLTKDLAVSLAADGLFKVLA